MRSSAFIIAGVLFLSFGCDTPTDIAPVSGTVTLDGKPLASAKVRFMPIPRPDDAEASRMMAVGTTDQQGQYSMSIVDGPTGAVVGMNRVWISTAVVDENDSSKLLVPEKVPFAYNVQSKLQFDVPPKGTESADFELKR